MSADIIMQNPVLYTDYDSPIVGGNPEEDQRALQIALQLSNLALLGCDDYSSYDDFINGKKTQNMTECVPVPSSEHVAEIVGKQGCKIKALRAKTNTYIKTPVRGEEPVFVVTGRKEDVAMARREVQSAAEHFTQIRASRNRHTMLANQALGTGNSEECPGTITLQVRVPYRVVGLVVGPKGATIKRIQQQTHTYIVTPSRDKEPVFEVTGLPENVEKAKEEIEAHIAARTGSHQTSIDDDFRNNGTEVGSPSTNTDFMEAAISAPFQTNSSFPYNVANKSVLRSNAPNFYPTSLHTSANRQNGVLSQMLSPSQLQPSETGDGFRSNAGSDLASFSECLERPSSMRRQSSVWGVGGSSQPVDKSSSYSFQSLFSSGSCFGGSERGNSLSPASSVSARFSRMSPTFSDKDFPALPSISTGSNPLRLPMHRVASEDSTTSSVPSSDAASLCSSTTTPAMNIESGYSSGSTTDSIASGSPTEINLPNSLFSDAAHDKPQLCVICVKNNRDAALVPCGHHLFCIACSQEIVNKPQAICPCCHLPASMALCIKK